MEILKAVIPAAGLGTRFLPYTKTVPKEMLPILNKPAIQYIVQEALDSSIKNFLMIINKEKKIIADHFGFDDSFNKHLEERGKQECVAALKKITQESIFAYINQQEPLGLGHAVWTARHYICKEYFSVLLPDEIIISKVPALSQLIKIARQEKASVVAVQEVPIEESSKYGMIGIKKQITPNLFQVSHVTEKPDKKDSPSNLAIIGRYILSSKIFPAIESTEEGMNGELQLTDAISKMIHSNEKLFAFKVQGTRYDVGNPIGWLQANIGCALQDPQYEPYINSFIKNKELLDSFIYNPTKIVENSL